MDIRFTPREIKSFAKFVLTEHAPRDTQADENTPSPQPSPLG